MTKGIDKILHMTGQTYLALDFGEFLHSRVDQIPAGLTVVFLSRDRRSERVHGGANSRRNGTG